MNCYCCSDLQYKDCCKPYLDGHAFPLTAEALMRSRYSAYCTMNTNYLIQTASGMAEHQSAEDIRYHHWFKLSILSTSLGKETDDTGNVEFKASFEENGSIFTMHEISQFRKINNRWFYVDGTHFNHE